MTTTYLSEIREIMSIDSKFDFSIDFQGQPEYIESTSTEEFLVFESIVLFLVEKRIIPVNERTEGSIEIKSGITTLNYRTCLQVGCDWNEDEWWENSIKIVVTRSGEVLKLNIGE